MQNDRIEDLLRELHREAMETRGATIKTDNSIRSLAGEIRQITERQLGYERRATVNSIVAYVLFASLSFGGLLMFFRASLSRAEIDRALVDEQQLSLQTRVEELEGEVERRRESERAAYEFYELLTSGRSADVVERWTVVQGRLTDRATIELFRREVDRIRHELAREAYELGLQNARNQLWEVARDAFTRSIAYVDVAPYSPSLYFHLAEALYNLDDCGTAIRYYDLSATAGSMERQQAILSHFHRAECLQRTERPLEAIEAYRQFARRYDDHHWAATARSRVERMEERQQQVETGAAAPGGQ
jgi:tetratricopeptide (TPR) repeat protein